ncbi:MAG: phosphatase PAP2 family protein, partial [Chloroflexi bacterium]|nr:phosphatase PAP2 family protein [Chloroflexota bacterium]
LFTSACGIGAWLLLLIGAAPRPLIVLGGALLVETLIIFVITLRWKISVHCAAAAGAATLVWSLIGTPLPLIVGVPLIAWSRLRLQRHTLAQVVAGSVVGMAIFLGAFMVI